MRSSRRRIDSASFVISDIAIVGKVVVKTTSWIGQDGMALTGQISIEGKVVFEKRWRK